MDDSSSSEEDPEVRSISKEQFCLEPDLILLPQICPICEDKNDPDEDAQKNRMIGCDGCDKWYHWNCVGIDRSVDCGILCCICGLEKQFFLLAGTISPARPMIGFVVVATSRSPRQVNGSRRRTRPPWWK